MEKINKIKQKYDELSAPVKASGWFVISNLVLQGISFITVPIFTRLLTTEQYGVVSVYQSWVSLISIISTLTIWGGVFNVCLTKYENEQAKVVSSFQGLAVTLSLILMFIACIFIKDTSSLMGISYFGVVCVFVEILGQIPYNLWATWQRYRYQYKSLVALAFIVAIVNPILGILFVTNTNYKADARIFSGVLVQFVVGLILFSHNLYKGKKFFSRKFWKIGFTFNIVLVPHYLSTQILNQSDRLMINKLCSSSAAGIYSVAYNLAMVLSIISNGISSSLTPYIYQCLKKKDTEELSKKVTRIVFGVAVVDLIFICVLPDVFHLLLPNSYYGAVWVMPPVAIGTFFLFLYSIFSVVEFYYEENRYVTVASVVSAVLNIILNWIFIHIYGYLAAAYTTLFCYFCCALAHYFFMKITLKKHQGELNIINRQHTLLIAGGLIIGGAIVMILYSYNIIRWSIEIGVILFAIVNRNKIVAYIKL